jgi:hypothetical protein
LARVTVIDGLDSNCIARSNSRPQHSLLEWTFAKRSKMSARWRTTRYDGQEKEGQARDALGTSSRLKPGLKLQGC